MVTGTLRSLHRNGLNYIFSNNRLLVSRLEDESHSTEAWLAKTPPSDAARDGSETKGWRLYASADGSELLKNVSELHPALQTHLVDENSEEFFSKGKEDRHRFLSERYDDVVRGRYKYCEREGGELKAMTSGGMFPRHSVSDVPQGEEQRKGQKKKREPDSSEESARDKKAKLFPGYYDENDEDDDEELPPYVKIESTDVDAMNQTPTFPEPATSDVQQHRPAQVQPQDQISASIANLDVAENLVPSDHKPADQEHDVRGAVKSDSLTLTTLANDLKKDLLSHTDEWMLYAGGHRLALAGFATRLRFATELDQVLAACRNILQWLNIYCEHIGALKLTQQQTLVDAKPSGIHVDIVQAHESLVATYQEKEKELRVVFEEMKQRVEALQAASGLS